MSAFAANFLHILEVFLPYLTTLGANAPAVCTKLAALVTTLAPLLDAFLPPGVVAGIIGVLNVIGAHGVDVAADVTTLMGLIQRLDPAKLQAVPGA